MKKVSAKKLALAGMFCALCVVGSVFSFPMFGSKCAPVQHMVNVLCAVLLFGAFTLSDYIAVTQFHQVPRFSYETVYDSRLPDQLVHKTLFFTAIQQNPGTPQERIYIAK